MRSSQLQSYLLRLSYRLPLLPHSTACAKPCIPSTRHSLFACSATSEGRPNGRDAQPLWAHLQTRRQEGRLGVGRTAALLSPISRHCKFSSSSSDGSSSSNSNSGSSNSSSPTPSSPRQGSSESSRGRGHSEKGSQDAQGKEASRPSPLSCRSSRPSPPPSRRRSSNSGSKDSPSRAAGGQGSQSKHSPGSSSLNSSGRSRPSSPPPSKRRSSSDSSAGHQGKKALPELGYLLLDAHTASTLVDCYRTVWQLGKRVQHDQQTGQRYTEQQLHEIEAAAGALTTTLLGRNSSSSSSNTSTSTQGAAPFQQLDSMQLSLTVWGFAILSDCTDSIKTRQLHQLVDGIAVHAVESSVMDRAGKDGCMHWGRLLYSTAKLGIKCQDSQTVQRLFDVAAQQFPGMLRQKPFNPQDVSNMLWAFATAEYPGSLRGLLAEVARNGAQAMEGANSQEWSDALWALGTLADRHVDLGERSNVNAIMGAGAASMAQLSRCNVEHYSKSLWGLAKAGCRPHGSIISKLAAAVAERSRDAKVKELSNTLWALAILDYNPDASTVSKLAAAIAERSNDGMPVDFSQSLWALAMLGWYDARQIPVMVTALAQHQDSPTATAQSFSNTLQALGTLCWYDASRYSQLVEGVLRKISSSAPDEVGQQLSNAMLSCAHSCHFDRSVDALAEWGSQQSVHHWTGQHVSNTLYAWAILSATSGGNTASMRKLAQHLFAKASERGVAAFQSDPEWRHDMGKLFSTHQEAVCMRLPGGGVSSELLQAASSERARVVAIVSKQLRGITSAVSAALQGVYDVQVATVQGYHALLVHHPSCPRGIAIAVTHPHCDYLCHPSDRLYGKAALQLEQMKRGCDGVLLCDEKELKGKDAEQQRDLLVPRIEQAAGS